MKIERTRNMFRNGVRLLVNHHYGLYSVPWRTQALARKCSSNALGSTTLDENIVKHAEPKAESRTEHFYRKELPSSCIAFASEEGKQIFKEAMNGNYMNCFFNLAAQFTTQDEPGYCGLSTLVMVLNALSVDPGKVWKGPWRWYHENMLECCIPLSIAAKTGITIDQFYCLAKCNGLDADMVQVTDPASINEFRNTIKQTSQFENQVLVPFYCRAIIGQTGTGHFSPVGGYHDGYDMVLIFDVARFKYPPHWLPVKLLWKAMQGLDPHTGEPRGYMILKQKNSTGNPTVLFKMSENFHQALDSQTEPEQLELLQTWSAWLNGTCIGEICQQKSEYFKQFVSKYLDIWHNKKKTEYGQLLNLQVDTKCCGELSEDHKYAISQLLDSLEKLPIFHCVEDLLNSSKYKNGSHCCDSFVRVVQDQPSVNNNCCCQKMEIKDLSTFTEVQPSHFVAMWLLSWPYEILGFSESAHVTHAVLFSHYIRQEMLEANEILKSEVKHLKNQFETVFPRYHQNENS